MIKYKIELNKNRVKYLHIERESNILLLRLNICKIYICTCVIPPQCIDRIFLKFIFFYGSNSRSNTKICINHFRVSIHIVLKRMFVFTYHIIQSSRKHDNMQVHTNPLFIRHWSRTCVPINKTYDLNSDNWDCYSVTVFVLKRYLMLPDVLRFNLFR